MTRAPLFLVAAAIAAGGIAPARALPAPGVVVTARNYYLPGDRAAPIQTELAIEHGRSLLYANLDAEGYHTVTAVKTDDAGVPLFDTGVDGMGPGDAALVHGVEALEPGVYDFYCRVHLGLMAGVLHVT